MGDLQRYLRHLIVFKGPTSKGREGKERAGEGKVKGREGKRRWRQGFGLPKKFGMAPLMLFLFHPTKPSTKWAAKLPNPLQIQSHLLVLILAGPKRLKGDKLPHNGSWCMHV